MASSRPQEPAPFGGEPPPTYDAATSNPPATSSDTSHLQVPHKTRSGIPPISRRSMEDEARPLPYGWLRQYDPESHHQFFVDITAEPPRSIWHHPYDDETYMSTLSQPERERIRSEYPTPAASHADMEAESSADDEHHNLPPRPEQLSGTKKLGRKMKDKLTNSTHQEREVNRRKREEEERRLYQQHQIIRKQMAKAAETGEPQPIGTDRDGKTVYVEPPTDGYGGMGYGGYAGGMGYGYNPYSSGMYGYPDRRYARPTGPYGRPYGYGYGGGMGVPLALGLGGGLMMGGLLF